MRDKEQKSGSTARNTVVQFPDKAQDRSKPYALIIGINGAIGNALATAYQRTHQVIGIARDIHNADHNFTLVQSDYSEAQLRELHHTLKGISEEFTVIVNCTGHLHNAIIQPEKNLEQLSERSLSYYFHVNATLPALLLKHLHPLLAKNKPSIFANLSAMVGSISDNKLGGWYGYRASKAALNMLVKTAAIEINRSNKSATIVAIHPGTTRSRLSAPFTKTLPDERLYPAELTAARLLKLLNSLQPEQTGRFFHWSGSELNW
jgi:NAD(P)-dependent dehydrogenase (short-subunit alcohol dehydrogenase family)